MFITLTVLMVPCTNTYIKVNQIVHLKYVQLIINYTLINLEKNNPDNHTVKVQIQEGKTKKLKNDTSRKTTTKTKADTSISK